MTTSAPRVIILKEDEVIERMSCLIDDVEIVFHLNKSEIRVLLHHFSWNKNAFLDAVAEDEEGTFKAVGLQKPSSSTKPVPVRNKCALAICQICYKTILRKDMDRFVMFVIIHSVWTAGFSTLNIRFILTIFALDWSVR